MAAGVHHARVPAGKPFPGGTVRVVCPLLHGQRVNVEPQRHHRAGAAVQEADHPGQALPHFTGQVFGGRSRLRRRCLRVGGQGSAVWHPHAGGRRHRPAAGQHGIAQIGKGFVDNGAGAHFQPAGFRITVDAPANLNQFGFHGVHHLFHGVHSVGHRRFLL